MTQIHNTVFISYRRANEFMAQAVHQYLLANGYDVFIDYKSIGAGSFGDVILRQIDARAHFLLVLTPRALERCVDANDWLRREIEHAIAHQRNVVPMMFAGVRMGDIEKYLTPAMQILPKYNALDVPSGYFEEAMTRLRQNFLDIAFETIIHPAPPSDTEVVDDIKEEAAAAPAPTEEQLTAEEYFERGNEYGEAGRFDEAIEAYSRAIDLNPNYAAAYVNRGSAYGSLGDYEAAMKDCDKALALNPSDFFAYTNRGNAYRYKGDHETAIADYNQALALNPNYAFAYHNRGCAYAEQGEYETALADYDKAIALNPDYFYAFYHRGCAHTELGAYEAAIADFGQVITFNPNFTEAYHRRSNAYFETGKYEEAMADCKAVLRINPHDEIARKNIETARRLKEEQT